MIVGVTKEIKTDEYRVAMIPVGVEELNRLGHQVLIQAGAGQGSGISDDQYASLGAEIVSEAADIWQRAAIVIKVKEPLPEEWPLLRPGQIVFTYFHFAADEKLTRAVMQSGITAIAYETIRDARGQLPLLTPMSEVAGRMSIQEGAKFLERPFEGRGILLGGVPGVLPANVVILGGGIVGANAAKVAAGLGANVSILDINLDRLRYLDDVMPKNVTTLFSDRHNIMDSLIRADLVIGAVLIPGARAPYLVRRQDLKRMVPVEVNVFGEVPWDSYTLMQIADSSYQGYSGLEHASSHVDIVNPQGIGSELMGRVIRAARNRGVQHLCVSCLAENGKMRTIARKYEAELRFEYGEVVGEIVPDRANYFSLLAEAVEDRFGYMMAVLDLQSRVVKAA